MHIFVLIILHSLDLQEITVEASAYCLQGTTATGTKVRPGIVSVDPKVIPLGSYLYLPEIGWLRAEDTGGAIKGRKIDIWNKSRRWCLRWGRRKVKVLVVKYHRKINKRR